jgi:hypothetical protein
MYLRVFNNKQVLARMLLLRHEGWTLHALAQEFTCDPSSVSEQCKRHSIKPIKIKFVVKIHRSVYEDFNGELVNKGSTYRQYLQREEERTQRQKRTEQV